MWNFQFFLTLPRTKHPAILHGTPPEISFLYCSIISTRYPQTPGCPEDSLPHRVVSQKGRLAIDKTTRPPLSSIIIFVAISLWVLKGPQSPYTCTYEQAPSYLHGNSVRAICAWRLPMCRSAQNNVRGTQTYPTPDLTLALAATLRGARGRKGQCCRTFIANKIYVHISKSLSRTTCDCSRGVLTRLSY